MSASVNKIMRVFTRPFGQCYPGTLLALSQSTNHIHSIVNTLYNGFSGVLKKNTGADQICCFIEELQFAPHN